MRKLQITGLYLALLLMLFFIPKPKSLLEMETYESKLRNMEQNEDKKEISILNLPQSRDTLSYLQKIP